MAEVAVKEGSLSASRWTERTYWWRFLCKQPETLRGFVGMNSPFAMTEKIEGQNGHHFTTTVYIRKSHRDIFT